MNLFKLELLKIKLSTYLWAIAGIFASLLALGVLFLIIFQFEMGASGTFDEENLFANWEGLLALTTALSFACFSIFSAVIAAKVIINEYCEKNAVILLSYPINRKSILKTKCIIVCNSDVSYSTNLSHYAQDEYGTFCSICPVFKYIDGYFIFRSWYYFCCLRVEKTFRNCHYCMFSDCCL